MNSIIKKLITGLLVIAGMSTGLFVQAAILTGQFEAQPLFKEANFIPGDAVTRWAKLTNTSGKIQTIAAQAVNFVAPIASDDLANALEITISQNGNDLYGGTKGKKTLADFYNAGVVMLSDVANNATNQYDFSISFPYEKGDEWQGKQTAFDIVIGIKNEGGGIDPTCTGSQCNGGGGGDTGECELRIIETPVSSVKANGVTKSSAQIIWSTNCLSDSLVVYSKDGAQHNFDLTKSHLGYTNESIKKGAYVSNHSIDLSDLSECTKYYFRVVSKNNKQAVSTEYQFTTFGCVEGATDKRIDVNDYLGLGGDKNIVEPQVAGEAIEKSECATGETCGVPSTSKPLQKVLGALSMEFNSCGTYEDLPWILIVLTACLYLYEKNRKDHFERKLKEFNYAFSAEDKKWKKMIWAKALIYPIIIIIILILYQMICRIIPWYFWLIILVLLYFRSRQRYFREYLQKILKRLTEGQRKMFQA